MQELHEKLGEKTNNVAVQLQLEIAGELFCGELTKIKDEMYLGASWINESHHVFRLSTLAESLGLSLSECLTFELELKSVMLLYQLKSKQVTLTVVDTVGRELLLSAFLSTGQLGLRLTLDQKFVLKDQPLIGKYLSEECLNIHCIQMFYDKKDGMKVQMQMSCNFANQNYELGEDSLEKPNKVLEQEIKTLPAETKKSSVKWKELNKKLGPVLLRRVGFSFEKGTLRICVDADITISILTFSVLELYLAVQLGKGFKFSAGIKGLALTVKKPPLLISGGLYLQDGFYNGMLMVSFKQFSLLALGSYGKEKKSGKDSFFAFLMLNYPFGGPPCFFLTGICAGFGVNRKLHIPDVKGVSKFPFIAAVRGASSKISPDSSVSEVLESLNDVVEPCEGMYFATVGIKFTSYEMVETVALVNVSFGEKFECSLLGVSELSIPPLVPNPIFYGCLNLRAVFAPDDGILLLEGALSDNSYLFYKDCKISGGFAFYTWFAGEWAGDFVISIGGYAPGFNRGHYPAVDRVGINWIISQYLTLTGEGYFAITPNGLMAGGRLALNFQYGKLRAWCTAYADLFIRFKPFYYDISIGVSVGISYRVKIWFVHHTFKLEMGADLHIWGPEFAGKMRVKWTILSFTIEFNHGGSKPSFLSFAEFRNSFLPKYQGGIAGAMLQGEKYARFQITNGLLGERSSPASVAAGKKYYVNQGNFQFEVESAFPLSQIIFHQKVLESNKQAGIQPMGLSGIACSLTVDIKDENGKECEFFTCEPVLKNLPRAIWNTKMPDKQDEMMKGMWTGCSLKQVSATKRWLPEIYSQTEKWYQLDVLLQSEKEMKKVVVKDIKPICDETGQPSYEEAMEKTFVQNQTRDSWLLELSDYEVLSGDSVKVGNFWTNRNAQMNAPFEVRTLGYRGISYES